MVKGLTDTMLFIQFKDLSMLQKKNCRYILFSCRR